MRERDQEQGRGTRFDAEEVMGRCGRRKKKHGNRQHRQSKDD